MSAIFDSGQAQREPPHWPVQALLALILSFSELLDLRASQLIVDIICSAICFASTMLSLLL